MTYQVALIASDGWVLASDQMQVDTRQIGWHASRVGSSVSKIFTDPALNLTYSTVGDPVAVLAGDELLRRVRAKKLPLPHAENTRQALVKLGDQVWRRSQKDISEVKDPDCMARGLTIFFSPEAREFWVLKIGRHSIAHAYMDKCVLGDVANPATFFLEHCYRPALSVSQLTFLAAHIVLMGPSFNSVGIGGLNITKSESGKVESLSSDQLHELEKRSFQVDWPAPRKLRRNEVESVA